MLAYDNVSRKRTRESFYVSKTKTPTLQSMIPFDLPVLKEWVLKINFHPNHDVCKECRLTGWLGSTDGSPWSQSTAQLASRCRMLSFSPLLMLANSSVAWHNDVTFLHYSSPCAVPNVWACKENVKNQQRAKLAKRAELPSIKLEYAPNCRTPNWQKWDAPNWSASNSHASKRTRQTGTIAARGPCGLWKAG